MVTCAFAVPTFVVPGLVALRHQPVRALHASRQWRLCSSPPPKTAAASAPLPSDPPGPRVAATAPSDSAKAARRPPPPSRPAAPAAPEGPAAFVRAVLLPAGWPASVAPGYARYAGACVARNAFRKANYVLGTTALLYALASGVAAPAGQHADAASSGALLGAAGAAGAAVKWTLKDGLGYAVKVSVSASIARAVDRDPKLFRLLGDILMAASVGVELLAPLRPALFLLVGSLASVLRQCADAMSGPAYRVFLNSFAISSNIGDVSSRAESQVVLGNILGLAAGASASAFLGNTTALTALHVDQTSCLVVFFLCFTAGHLAAVRTEISAMQLRTLNRKRLTIILDHYLATGHVLSVDLVNRRERLSPLSALAHPEIELGADLSWLPHAHHLHECDTPYAFTHDPNRRIRICLRHDVTTPDLMRAVLQATKVLHDKRLEESEGKILTKPQRSPLFPQVAESAEPATCIDSAAVWAKLALPDFLLKLGAAGWETDKLLLETGTARYGQDYY